MKILMYKWKVYNQSDVAEAFEYFGYTVDMYEEKPVNSNSITGYKEHDMKEISDVISEYDIVFSLNYFPHISDVCEKLGKKYIAWTVDSPLISLYHQSVFNSCNYIFIFDKFFYYELKQMGVRNVYYLPLAVNTERLDKLIGQQSKEDRQRFAADVSFVGSMYHKNSYDDIKDKLPPYMKGYFDAAMLAQLNIYGDNIIDDLLTVDIFCLLYTSHKIFVNFAVSEEFIEGITEHIIRKSLHRGKIYFGVRHISSFPVHYIIFFFCCLAVMAVTICLGTHFATVVPSFIIRVGTIVTLPRNICLNA